MCPVLWNLPETRFNYVSLSVSSYARAAAMSTSCPPTFHGESSTSVAISASAEQRDETNVIIQQIVPRLRGRTEECNLGRIEAVRDSTTQIVEASKSTSQGPYGQLVAGQVDESVPSSYQKSPKQSHRPRPSAMQQRPSSLPVVPLVDHAVCERPANLTPTSSMLVTPENPSTDPPISPI